MNLFFGYGLIAMSMTAGILLGAMMADRAESNSPWYVTLAIGGSGLLSFGYGLAQVIR